tara:strand:- start:15892 stop:17094 length:1203 start_codon:yes stop_codon:yes gene_type:complete
MHDSSSKQTILSVALIGVSGYGRVHLRVLESLQAEGRVTLAAATVINRNEEEELCQQLESQGCKIFRDYREMLSEMGDVLDLCCIPTGISWHKPMTIDALEAGCHVLVEKPAAGTVEEVDAMIAAQERTGKYVFVGFQDTYAESVRSTKSEILAGKIGTVKEIRTIASWPRSQKYYERNNWAGRITSGGKKVYDSPANNALAHYLMASLYFAGTAEDGAARATTVEAELYRASSIESFDTISAKITTNTGVEIDFSVTHKGIETIHPIVEIVGTEGSVRWEIDHHFTFMPEGREVPCAAGDSSRHEMFQLVLESIETGVQKGCSLQMAREHTRVIESLHENVPILDIDPQYVFDCEFDGGPHKHVDGIEDAVRKVLGEGGLFSELDIPWAKQSTAYEVSL